MNEVFVTEMVVSPCGNPIGLSLFSENVVVGGVSAGSRC